MSVPLSIETRSRAVKEDSRKRKKGDSFQVFLGCVPLLVILMICCFPTGAFSQGAVQVIVLPFEIFAKEDLSYLQKEIPDVDEYFGTSDLPALLKVLEADYKHELLGERLITTPKSYAYLKIAEGCDRPCSFCAIPLMRGKHRSKPAPVALF